MALYRPLAPAVPKVCDTSDLAISRPGPPVSKKRQTQTACNVCRRRKAKCGGERPRCSSCIGTDSACVYERDPGQSKVEAMKARLETLESLLEVLQLAPKEEAEELLHRMRSSSHLPHHTVASSSNDNQANLGALWGVDYFLRSVPDRSKTQRAVDGFFSCSGKLFHVFSQEQATRYYNAVFNSREGPFDKEAEIAAGCICAIAAVGSQYVAGALDPADETAFYTIARHYFETILAHHPLDAIKVCTLLAMFNIMGKATIALSYVEIGLSMSRQYHLDDKGYRPKDCPPQDWISYRKTWRTLMFLASWLSSTLGYISGNEILVRSVPLSEMDVETPTNMVDMIQAEMTKISLLKAEMLRMHMAFKELTVLSLESILNDLQRWYEHLPREMLLDRLLSENRITDTEVRRSLYHVHLLYLGAIVLLYRRLASQIVRSCGFGDGHNIAPFSFTRMAHNTAEQGVLAASQSARIVKIFLDESGIYRRCWLIIFQTFVSCVVILHSAAQKHLWGFPSADWDEELQLASGCFEVLEFCAAADPAATKLKEKLQPFYTSLISWKQSAVHEPELQEHAHRFNHQSVPSDYLLKIPHNANSERAKFSLILLEILCRPFGDVEVFEEAKQAIDLSRSEDPSRFEHSQLIERLDLEFEARRTYQWDFREMITRETALERRKDSGQLEMMLDGDQAQIVKEEEIPTSESRGSGTSPLESRGSGISSLESIESGYFLSNSVPGGWR